MKTTSIVLLSVCTLCLSAILLFAQDSVPKTQEFIVAAKTGMSSSVIPNRLIDYNVFIADATALAEEREKRRVTEEQFLEMAGDPQTIIFDARSTEKYQMLHVKNARHLSLPDITADELQRVIPSKETRILIYCNNNFLNDPLAFASKTARASLNIYTFNVLHSYGYKSVYELGPLMDIRKSKIPFEGTMAKPAGFIKDK